MSYKKPLHDLDTRLVRGGKVYTVSAEWGDGTIEITPGEWDAPTGPARVVPLNLQPLYTACPTAVYDQDCPL